MFIVEYDPEPSPTCTPQQQWPLEFRPRTDLSRAVLQGQQLHHAIRLLIHTVAVAVVVVVVLVAVVVTAAVVDK